MFTTVQKSTIKADILAKQASGQPLFGVTSEAAIAAYYNAASGSISWRTEVPTKVIRAAINFSAHAWQPRRWEWVDPLKDIEADIAAINAGLKSPQSVAAKLGWDYEDLLVEIKAATDLRKTIGVELPNTPNPQQLAAAAGAAASATPTA